MPGEKKGLPRKGMSKAILFIGIDLAKREGISSGVSGHLVRTLVQQHAEGLPSPTD